MSVSVVPTHTKQEPGGPTHRYEGKRRGLEKRSRTLAEVTLLTASSSETPTTVLTALPISLDVPRLGSTVTPAPATVTLTSTLDTVEDVSTVRPVYTLDTREATTTIRIVGEVTVPFLLRKRARTTITTFDIVDGKQLGTDPIGEVEKKGNLFLNNSSVLEHLRVSLEIFESLGNRHSQKSLRMTGGSTDSIIP